MSRPWFYPEARQQEAPRVRPQVRTGAPLQVEIETTIPEPPLLMVPEKPCPCEVMEALLRALGEPESDDWLEHFTQENRTFIPLLRKLGFDEAARQLLDEHKILIGQIQQHGAPDYNLLKRHAAFEDALAKQLGDRMIAMKAA